MVSRTAAAIASKQCRGRRSRLSACAVAVLAAWAGRSALSALSFVAQAPGTSLGAANSIARQQRAAGSRTLARASVVDSIKNPVKTVAESIADFYKAYPVPPVLPMYRSFLIDFLTQTHLTVFDSRFKYDAIFALGLKQYYQGLMGSYDKIVGGPQSEKIWQAYLSAVGLDAATVDADAEAAASYGSSTSPADILKQMEGADDSKVGQAFSGIKSSLYSFSFSVGLFTLMENAKVEVNKANAEEWAKALQITPSKVTSDLETYKLNKNKVQKAEEMIREVEIREKKKLAERLEAKAKALAEKAAGKKKEASSTDA